MADDTLIYFGDTVKALDDNGRVGGYLVRYTAATDPDLTGDFFAADTDLGDSDKLPVLYQHGLDERIKQRRIGRGELRRDDVGVWIEAQLELRDEYERAIYNMARNGKLGWSSGAAAHTVTTETVGGAKKIKQWYLAEASLTPVPAEPRNSAVMLKMLLPTHEGQDKPSVDDGENETPETETEITKMDETTINETAPNADMDALKARLEALEARPVNEIPQAVPTAGTHIKSGLGDSEFKAFKAYLKTGQLNSAMKASNNTDMNVGTAADGGYAVPTGHYDQIIARRDQSMLANLLGVRRIPGIGTTVNVPLDAEADGEFVATAEAAATDRDAPAIGQAAMTLVKYTKRIELSWELLEDEDSRLEAFLSDFVGRGMAKTHNALLMTEAGNATSGVTFASTTAIAAGEIDTLPFGNDLSAYLDDTRSVGWVTRASTYGSIVALAGNNRLYSAQDWMSMASGRSGQGSLMGYPVHFTDKVAAPAASAKSIYFGNWNFMGMREAPGFSVLRDPYSKAANGQVVLHYYFRTVYKLLQAEAIAYGVQAAI